jgi:hypothetical protein
MLSVVHFQWMDAAVLCGILSVVSRVEHSVQDMETVHLMGVIEASRIYFVSVAPVLADMSVLLWVFAHPFHVFCGDQKDFSMTKVLLVEGFLLSTWRLSPGVISQVGIRVTGLWRRRETGEGDTSVRSSQIIRDDGRDCSWSAASRK